jgi:hypothetical protein
LAPLFSLRFFSSLTFFSTPKTAMSVAGGLKLGYLPAVTATYELQAFRDSILPGQRLTVTEIVYRHTDQTRSGIRGWIPVWLCWKFMLGDGSTLGLNVLYQHSLGTVYEGSSQTFGLLPVYQGDHRWNGHQVGLQVFYGLAYRPQKKGGCTM